MKWNKTILAAAAVVLPLSVGIGSALSYFTDNVSSSGGYAVEVGEPQTEITETFGNWTKHVTVTNTGEIPVYIRARAFSGSQYELVYSGETGADGAAWTVSGDYYEYNRLLGVGETTPVLNIEIKNVPQDATDRDSFNVVVIYERTPAVQYNEDGSVKLDENGRPVPDWNYKVVQQTEFPTKTEDSGTEQTEGGNES